MNTMMLKREKSMDGNKDEYLVPLVRDEEAQGGVGAGAACADDYDRNDGDGTVRAYKSRFWVLGVFSFLAVMQSCTWNIYAPIQQEVNIAFGWDNEYIKWSVNTANIAFVLVLAPTSLAIGKYGFRRVVVVSGFLLFLCVALRLCCFIKGIHDGSAYKVISLVAMVLNGASGGVSNFGGPVLSERWFPPNERTTATAVGTVSCYLGSALGFLIGPLIVGEPRDADAASRNIALLFVWEAALVSVGVIAAILYFPERPPTPPSEAAALKLQDVASGTANGKYGVFFGKSSKDANLVKFWWIVLGFGLPLGCYQAWTSILDLCLGDFISSAEAGVLGCLMTTSGCIGSVIVGAFMDKFSGRLKLTSCALLFISCIAFILFCINGAGGFALDHGERVIVAYVLGILGGFAFNCSIPLCFEMVLETVFPWGDSNAASSLIVLTGSSIQVFFLLVPNKINGSAQWTGWVSAMSVVAAAFMVAFVKLDYARLRLDSASPSVACRFDKAGVI